MSIRAGNNAELSRELLPGGLTYFQPFSMAFGSGFAFIIRADVAITAKIFVSNKKTPDFPSASTGELITLSDWIEATDIVIDPVTPGSPVGCTVGNAHFRWYMIEVAGTGGSVEVDLHAEK